jgi:hypothetical protein
VGQRWWDRPVLPYLVLAVSPVLTFPISAIILARLPDCGVDEPWWELRHFEIAFVPALADLSPLLWLASGRPEVRGAALLAGLVAAGRLAIPQAATLVYGLSSGGQAANPDCTVSSFFAAAVLGPMILALWLASLLIAAVLLRAGRVPAPD